MPNKRIRLSLQAVKNIIKYILQQLLGYQRYLMVFSIWKIKTLRRDKKEGDFFQFMREIEKGEGVILDVGANIGIMSAHLSSNFPNNRILAVEPMPDNLEVLEQLQEKYNWQNVQVFAAAVGREPGTVTMILPNNGRTKMQGLSHVKCDDITEWNEGEEVEVEMTTLDEIAAGQKVLGIKMDVENYEYEALLGARELLTQHHPVLYLELWDNENRQKCFHFLKELGYSVYIVHKGSLQSFDAQIHSHQNFIFKAN